MTKSIDNSEISENIKKGISIEDVLRLHVIPYIKKNKYLNKIIYEKRQLGRKTKQILK